VLLPDFFAVLVPVRMLSPNVAMPVNKKLHGSGQPDDLSKTEYKIKLTITKNRKERLT